MQHLNFSYSDAYRLPVWKRTWFLQKLKHDLEIKKQNQQQASSNRNKNIFKKSF